MSGMDFLLMISIAVSGWTFKIYFKQQNIVASLAIYFFWREVIPLTTKEV